MVLPADDAVGPADRVLEEVRRLEDRVGDAEVEGLLALEHAVVLQRVLDDDLEGVLDADEVRQQPGATPAGDDAEEDLGQRERGHRAVDRAVVGVEADLDAATEREPVDEDEGRHAELAELAERPVAELRHLLGEVAARDVADLREVGARGEDERLAGDGDTGDLARGLLAPSARRARRRTRPG